jgi:D-inositol-3-phosphate glycosyltransferase
VDGVSGRLVRGHDPARWAHAIAGLLADPQVRGPWRTAARRVAAGYGWDTTAEQILTVYALAAQRRARL